MGPNGLKVQIVVLIQLQRALHDPSGEKGFYLAKPLVIS